MNLQTGTTDTLLQNWVWKRFQTVIVFAAVSMAVWWAPVGNLPGVLMAADEEQAWEMIDEMEAPGGLSA